MGNWKILRDNKKNILFISQEMTYSGSPHSLLRMCKVLQKNNYNIEVWSFKDGEFVKEFNKFNIKVKIVPEAAYKNYKYIKKETKGFDLAICNTVITSFAYNTLRQCFPSIWYIREAQNLGGFCKNNTLREHLLKNANGIYCVSEYAQEFIKKTFHNDATIVHNCVEDFSDSSCKQYFKDNKLNLLCLGTFEYRKGFDTIIDAIFSLPAEMRKNIKLKIAGELREGKGYKDYYRPLLEKIKQCPEIEYIGVIKGVEEKKQAYLNADVVVVPSRDESCSLVALEGIMMSCPIIVTENVGAKYVVNQNTGWVYETGDVNQLSFILRDILDKKYDIEVMGQYARKQYEEMANMKVYGENILNMVECAMKNKTLIENHKVKTAKPSDLKKLIRNSDVISFDIFDTLLIRPYVKPTDLFYHIEQNYNCAGYAETRIMAEQKARKTLINKSCEDITLDEIYENISKDFEHLKKVELEYEYKLLNRHTYIYNAYKYALWLGKKIVITSDMYLPDYFLKDVLNKNGYKNFEKLYLSSSLKKSKRTGTLYDEIIKDYPNKKILHIGDNINSDIKEAQKKGLDTYYVEKIISKYIQKNHKAKILLEKLPNNVGASIMLMLFARKNSDYKNFWEKIGYEYGGPVSYGYTNWIKKSLIERNIKNIAFIARDGYTLQKVFNLQKPKDINSYYIYAPRILKSELESSKNKRREYHEYLSSIIGDENLKGRIAIVDTMTNRLTSQKIIGDVVNKENIFAYYWAISRKTNEIDESYNFTSYHAEPYIWNKSLRHWDFMELLMTAPEPPVMGIKNKKPVYSFKIYKEEKKRIKTIPIISKNTVNFTRDLLKIFNDIDVKFEYTEICSWLNILADLPEIQDIKNMNEIKHAQNASHDKYVNLFPNWHKAFPVILASDNNYAPQMLVTIISLLENKNINSFYDFYLLIPKKFSKKILNAFKQLDNKYFNFKINFIEMHNDFISNKMQITHITHPTYYRLKAAQKLPLKYDKALYLDVDTIVLKDLNDIFDIDLKDAYIAGIEAAGIIINHYKSPQYFDSIGISNMDHYINAGVTLWNLKRIREDNLTPKLLSLANNNYRTMDQDVINVAFQNNIKILPFKYNIMTKYKNEIEAMDEEFYKLYGEKNIEEGLESPYIIHYADKIKPWADCNSYKADYWWKYANLSPYKFEKDVSLLQDIFSVRNNPTKSHKIITICGLKIKIKKEFLKRLLFFGNQPSADNKWYKIIYILGIKIALRNKKKEEKVRQEQLYNNINSCLQKIDNCQQGIDNCLQKFEACQHNIDNYSERVGTIGKEFMEFKTENNSQNIKVVDMLQNLRKCIDSEVNTSKDISNNLEEQRKQYKIDNNFYYSPYEINTREERGLCDITSVENFEERFDKLISGLIPQDVATIVTIIRRLQMIKGIKNPIDIFSIEEKALLKDIENKRKHILKISDNRYCYQNYSLPINHFEASVFYYKHGMHLLENPEIFQNKAIIDVGAFIGDSALILSPYTNDKVYCFEAVSQNYDYLLQTVEMNNLPNIISEKLALGAEEGEFEMRVMNSGSSIDSLMIKNPEYIEKCKVTTLDKYVKEHNLQVGLIKVDIEGAEQLFLRGAEETIKSQKPTLLLSIYHNVNDFLDIKPLIESWNLGYKFRIFKPTIMSITGETLLICEQKENK